MPMCKVSRGIFAERCIRCSKIAMVEHLLNLLWLAVASVLFVVTVRSHKSGKLRCSLPVALGCAALIALTLFPVLSMTDDVARAKLYDDEAGGHHGNPLPLRSLEDSELSTILDFGLPLLLLMAAALAAVSRMARRSDVLASAQTRGLRPHAVRPPPSIQFPLAA
jgi:hypothetical protein